VDGLGKKPVHFLKRATLNGKIKIEAKSLPLVAAPARDAI
jgi:hypothetical protein